MATMGLSAAEHHAWAMRNLESYREACDRFRNGMRRQRCDVAALLDMHRHAYGVELNAKDAGDKDLAAWAHSAREAIHGFIARACRGKVRAKICGAWWTRNRGRLDAPQ